ncbi:hypothetical protein ACEWY4_006563 [Coilia grayii]|uniref:Transmembrane protein family 132 middle domain-containing protein n=1 Tax=Coilia grayii TaxID=363190 RepID=A0ABD1KE85_9TELE
MNFSSVSVSGGCLKRWRCTRRGFHEVYGSGKPEAKDEKDGAQSGGDKSCTSRHISEIKFEMDCMLNLVVFFLGLLLVNADSEPLRSPQGNASAIPVTSNNSRAISAPSPSKCPKVTAPTPLRKVVLVKVTWDSNNPCRGAVHLSLPRGGHKPVCFGSTYTDEFEDLCQQRRCEKFLAWEKSEQIVPGHYVNGSGRVTNTNCHALIIQCKGPQATRSQGKTSEGAYNGELVAYKAVTGLLILLVLAVLLFFFGKPTYSAIRKRMSQKRQTRWIGPTQTQSVYYHRDQPPGPNNNTFKRHSYPGMSAAGCPSSHCKRGVVMVILLCSCFALAGAQLPTPISLPAQITVTPPWRALSLSQSDLGVLFSNSSPFSHSQSLLLMPPPGPSPKAGVRASFGPYSVTQMVSTPILSLSPPLSASLLTKTVLKEKQGDKGERFEVRVLFHMRGDTNKGTCITLHAFKETQEQKASCITQSPLGLCVVSLSLPKDWFELGQTSQAGTRQNPRLRYQHRHRHRQRSTGRRRHHTPSALRDQPGAPSDHIHLYYSSSGTVPNLKLPTQGCAVDDTQPLQRRLYYVGAVALPEREKDKAKWTVGCSGGRDVEELRLDYNVLLHYRPGPVRTGQPIGISVNLRSNFTGDSITIRLKVKKGLLGLVDQPSMNSDLWIVTLEKSTGSKHDTISIICHKVGTQSVHLSQTDLLEVACLLVDGLKRSFGVAMTVTIAWWVEYSSRNTKAFPHGAVTSFLSFADRDIVGIAPITESSTIINTAILNSQPVTLPVTVLGIGNDGKVSDVTSAVRCQSANEDIIKVSSDCSTLFVDGSESGVGSTCVEVDFSLGRLRGSVCLSVWTPVVPLRISLSDSVLSAIDGWSYFNQGRCTPVFQRSTVQVLAQFSAHPSTRRGQPSYMLGSPDWFVDVTEMVWDWLQVGNSRVATLSKQGFLIGLEPGITTLHVISSQWDGVLGSAEVVVTSETVAPGDLSVQLIGGLGLTINPNPAHQSVISAAVTAHNILYNYGQEASVSIWLQFNDDTAILVSAFSSVPYSLRLSSLAESVVAVTPEPLQRVLAQGEGGGPLVKAELLVSTCETLSNDIETNVARDGGTRRLAKGSGWIRVNLDSEVWPIGSDTDNEMFDVSEMLSEADKDLYGNFGDKAVTGNITSDYTDNAGNDIITRNKLERAVLTPNHQESAVYFSPGVGKDKERPLQGDRDLEVGLGAVLSLLCLSALLFLANCLPCALRDRRRRKQREKEGLTSQGITGELQVETSQGKGNSKKGGIEVEEGECVEKED